MSAVYLVAANEAGPCKVGFAADPVLRLRELQTGSAARLKLYGIFPTPKAKELERKVHDRLGHANMTGEWFGIPVERAWEAIVAEHRKSYPVAPHVLPIIEDEATFKSRVRRQTRERVAAKRLNMSVKEYRETKEKSDG